MSHYVANLVSPSITCTWRLLWNVFIKQQFTVLPRTKTQRGNESHNWRPATLKIKSRYHYTIFLYFLAIVGGWCQYTACILLAAWNRYLIVVTWEGSLYDIVSIANQLNWTDNHRPHTPCYSLMASLLLIIVSCVILECCTGVLYWSVCCVFSFFIRRRVNPGNYISLL